MTDRTHPDRAGPRSLAPSRQTTGGSYGVKCPYCDGHRSIVTDSRPSGDNIRRTRHCMICNGRYTTYEIIATTFEAAKVYSGNLRRGLHAAIDNVIAEFTK